MANVYVGVAEQLPPSSILVLESGTLAVDSEAESLCAGLTEEQLAYSMLSERWSIAQNLAHLRTTAEIFLPVIDSVIEHTRHHAWLSHDSSGLGLYGRLMVWQMDSRWMFKLRAPLAIQPRLLSSPCLELEQFLLSQSAMRKRMREAAGLNLTAIRFSSPVARFVRMNLLECFSVLNAHCRRHLRQAKSIRRAMDFTI